MAKSKMTTCKHCGAEIAASAKVCPRCGGKNKPPIYKRWWFIVLVVLIVLSAIGGSSDDAKKGFEEGYKDATVSSNSVSSKTESVASSAETDSSTTNDEEKAMKYFLKISGESKEFAENLEKALPLAGLDYTLYDINWFEQTDDWAAGSRYNAQINGKIYIQIDTIGDEIYSIKDTKNGATDDYLYKNDDLKPDAGDVPDGSILLADGELGDYGENAKTKSGYEYVRYNVPTGNYTVENKAKQSSVFVVSNSNSDDVSASLQLTTNGEKASLTVKDGYHIELSMYAQILLTPDD